MEENWKILGKNIKFLRKRQKETQKELGDFLHISHQYVSQFENGKRNPLPYLSKIAEHYNVPETLLDQEITEEMLKPAFEYIQNMDVVKTFCNMFIRFKAPRENIDFNFADKDYQYILEGTATPEKMKRCRERYFDAYKKAFIFEGAANALHVMLLEYLSLSGILDLTLDLNNITMAEVVANVQKKKGNHSPKARKFIKETEEMFTDCLKALRSDFRKEGTLIAEYYLMLKYMLNMSDEDYDLEDNASIAWCYCDDFCKLGNKYVLEFAKPILELLENYTNSTKV